MPIDHDELLLLGASQEDGDNIDCARMGVGGKAIPPNVDKVWCCVVQWPCGLQPRACWHAARTTAAM